MTHKNYYKRNSYQLYIKNKFPSKYLLPESFDLIYSNSSIEHWHESIEDSDQSLELYKKDISFCYKILKPGGYLLINTPIHVHGNKIFVHGKIEKIEKFFNYDYWKSITFEHWREQFDDLMPYAPVHRKKAWINKYGYDFNNIWIGNIVAKK